MKIKAGILGIIVTSALMVGCGSPSKEDVCGKCESTAKSICELAYDACDDDGDCIDSLEDAKPCG